MYTPALWEIVLGKTRANAKMKRTNRHSPFQALEAKLYRKFQEMRSKDRKVSSTWITVSEKKIFVELQEKEPNEWETKEFKASHG